MNKKSAKKVFIMDNVCYTLWDQQTSALLPSPGRETREGVYVTPQQPSGVVFACFFIARPLGPETSLSQPSSSVCRS